MRLDQRAFTGSAHAPAPALVVGYPVSYLSGFLLGGQLAEEPGWRGFALPRLQQRWGPLVGTLLLGVLWGLWHAPGQSGWSFVAFVLFITAFAVLLTWLFNNTGVSLLLTMLANASLNTTTGSLLLLFPALSTSAVFLCAAGIFGAVALLLILATRGQLGYQRFQREMALHTSPVGAEQTLVATSQPKEDEAERETIR